MYMYIYMYIICIYILDIYTNMHNTISTVTLRILWEEQMVYSKHPTLQLHHELSGKTRSVTRKVCRR